MKTEEGMYVLYTERDKIHANSELRNRLTNGQLSDERFKRMILLVTESEDLAERATVKFITEKEKIKK